MQSVFSFNHYAAITRTLQEHLLRYGYLPQETQIIDDANLFLTKAGDQIIDRLFTFQRNGRELAFRPEFTTLASRHYALDEKLHNQTVRWQFSGPIFSTEQSSGMPDFSIGSELIGVASTESDVEILNAAINGLLALKINNFQIILGHAGLINAVMDYFALDMRTQRFIIQHRAVLRYSGQDAFLQKLRQYLPLYDKTQPQSVDDDSERILAALLNTRPSSNIGSRSAEDIARRLSRKQKQASEYDRIAASIEVLEVIFGFSHTAQDAIDRLEALLPNSVKIQSALSDWKNIIALLQSQSDHKPHIVIQPDLALSWDYYTGIVFEVFVNDKVVLSGGRYDDLITLMGLESGAPAVGFAYNLNNIQDVTAKKSAAAPIIFTMLMSTNRLAAQECVRWQRRLRDSGVNVQSVFESEQVGAGDYVMRIEGDKLIMPHLDREFTSDEIDCVIEALGKTIEGQSDE